MDIFQHTLIAPVEVEGVGLHTGEWVRVRINPAKPNSGIRFVRKDIKPNVIIPATHEFAIETRLCTAIGVSGITIYTIEHLMAAFAGLGIDNALVEVWGPEIPICDGSSKTFVDKILGVGLATQRALRKYLKILAPIELQHEDKNLTLTPHDSFLIDCSISYDHPLLRNQRLLYNQLAGDFQGIYNARTFCFLRDVTRLRDLGLIRGGSLSNAIVLDDDGIINSDGLRHEDEFVRHKTLDILGDLYLIGYPILGMLSAIKSGHALHLRFIKKILENRDTWAIIALESTLTSRLPNLKWSSRDLSVL